MILCSVNSYPPIIQYMCNFHVFVFHRCDKLLQMLYSRCDKCVKQSYTRQTFRTAVTVSVPLLLRTVQYMSEIQCKVKFSADADYDMMMVQMR